jgi:hypothetical protein
VNSRANFRVDSARFVCACAEGKIDEIHKEIEAMRKNRSELSKIKRASFTHLPGHVVALVKKS